MQKFIAFLEEQYKDNPNILEWLSQYQNGVFLPIPFDQLDFASLTEFQQKVLYACAAIPVGEVKTYGEIAIEIGNPKAVRAVGHALNQNPYPIIIPCHRVVAKNGMGGYAFGNEIKIALLTHEKDRISS